MKIKRYSETDFNEWNTFIECSKNGFFMFHRRYMEYHADRFKDHSLMFYDDENTLLAILPANEKEGTLYSHQGLTFGGFIVNTSTKASTMVNLFSTLIEYLKNNQLNKLIYKAIPYIYHQSPAQEDLFAITYHKGNLIKATLSSSIDQSSKIPFNKGRRAQVSRAIRTGIIVNESEDLGAFMAILEKRLEEKYESQPTHRLEELQYLKKAFPNNIKLSRQNQFNIFNIT